MNESIKFLDTKDVAKALRCSLPKARQIMCQANFPLIKVGKVMRVSEEAFRNWSLKRRI